MAHVVELLHRHKLLDLHISDISGLPTDSMHPFCIFIYSAV